MRLIIDANIWISALLTHSSRHRIETIFDLEYHLIVSEDLFVDLENAIHKPYPAKRIVREEYDKLIAKLRTVAELIDVHSVVEICRDPKDNFLLALAKDGNADYLITGDDDLLVLEAFEKTKIVKLTDFGAAFA